MESLYILIPIAIVLVCVAVAIFLWAVKSEQFEDLERQGHNILFEDDEQPKSQLRAEKKTDSPNSQYLNQSSDSQQLSDTQRPGGGETK